MGDNCGGGVNFLRYSLVALKAFIGWYV